MNLKWRLAALKNGLQDATAYRGEFLFEVLGSALVPACVQWVNWYAAFVLAGRTEIAGKTYAQMMHYTLFTILFSQVRGGDLDFELCEMIRSGQLSNYLLRPVSVVEFIWIRGIASKLLIAGIGLIMGIALGFWLGLTPGRMFGSMLLALMGNMIHYQIGATLSTTAFFWEEAYSMLMVKNLFVSFLSGELIPLFLFPTRWSWIWKSTPFYLYVYAPTQYALGEISNEMFFHDCLIGIAWMVGCALLIRMAWALGIKRYLSLGG